MKAAWTIFQWELRRVLTNWRQAMTIFIVPSAVLLLVLYAFPLLMDFMATGNIGKPTIYVVDPPESFSSYMQTLPGNFSYSLTKLSQDEFNTYMKDGSARSLADQGSAFVVFTAPQFSGDRSKTQAFDKELERYYSLSAAGTEKSSLAQINVLVAFDNLKSNMTANLFSADVLPGYNDHLLNTVGQEYVMAGGGTKFTTNEFNPVTELMLHRSTANTAAAQVLPAAVFLLLYYCIYSISFDAVGAERERGFLAKVALTPVRKSDIIIGKALAITLIGLLNSITIIIVFILASWTNFQNNPFSLIPFGFTLFPGQMASVVFLIASAALVLSLFCFIIIFSCGRPQDVLLNLQFPLILFLVYFFINIFRFTDSIPFEAYIPIHGAMVTMRDVLFNKATAGQVLTVVVVHTLTAIVMLLICHNVFRSSYSYNEIEEKKQ